MTRYHFTTATGETHGSDKTPEEILAAHPGAVITDTVETDPVTGESTLTPYEGEATSATGPTGASGPTGMTAPVQDDQTAQPTQESSSAR